MLKFLQKKCPRAGGLQALCWCLFLIAALAVPWASQAQTSCDNGTITVANSQVSNATTSYCPGYSFYNYSVSEVLVLSSELEGLGGEIYSMQFKPASTSAGTYFTNCEVYLALTTQSDLSAGWIQDNSLHLVFTGDLSYTTTDWQTITFDTAFNYDPNYNLVVLVRRNHGSYTSGSSFEAYNTGATRVRYAYQDSDPYTIGSLTGTNTSTDAPLYRFTGCYLPVACAHVNDLTVNSLSSSEVTLSWLDTLNSGATYKVVNLADNSLLASVTDTIVTITDLTPNTLYDVAVYADCGGGDSSTNLYISFRTLCVPILNSDLPYTYGFEDATGSGAAQSISSCWTRHTNYSTAYPYPSTSQVHSGTYSLYFYSTSSYYSYVTLPPFDDNLEDLYLTFWGYKTSANYGHVYVGVMSDPSDLSTFDTIATLQVGQVSSWEFFEVPLSGYTGDGGVLAFLSPNLSSASYIYIDDITVSEPPACPSPSDIAGSNATSNSVDVSWTSTASEFIVEYGPQGFTPGQGHVVISSSNSITLTGLVMGSYYGVYVTAVCGSDTSNPAFGLVATGCGAITEDDLPFVEDFESYSSGSAYPINLCWTKGTSSTTAYPYPTTTSVNGARGLYYYGYNTTSTTSTLVYSWAALPPVDDDLDISTLQLNFNVKRGSTSSNYYTTLLYIGIADSVNAFTSAAAIESSVTWIDTVNHFSAAASSIHSEEIPFDSYQGTGKYVVIYCPIPDLNGSATYCYNYAYVDDVVLRTIPTCFWPTAVNVDAVSTDEVEISWTPDSRTPNPSNWIIEYGEHGFFLGEGTIETSYSNSITLTGLDANTEYDVYVRANCGGEESDSRMISFRTACEPFATLPYTENFDGITGSTATSPTASYLPNCWDYYNHGTRTNYQFCPYVYSSSTYSHSGSNCIRFYSYTGSGDSSQYLILPEIDPDNYALSDLQVSFWLRAYSTSSTYHADVIVGVMSNIHDASSFVPCTTFTTSSTTYSFYQYAFGNYTGNNGRIAFKFPLPTASSNYEYGYIDDITVEPMPSCPPVTNLEAVTTTGSALLTWDYMDGYDEPSGYEIVYDVIGGSGTTETSSDPYISLTGLTAGTTYKAYVRAACGSDYGSWDSVTFATAEFNCIELDPETADTVQVSGTTASTSYYVPLGQYYNYSYTQQIVLASEMNGATTLTGIDFQYSYSTATTQKTNVTIYLANTTTSSLTSAFVPYSPAFVPVYTGPINGTQGWNHYEFTTPFSYDGTSNLLIIIHDNSGAYPGSSYVYATHSATGLARYVQNDSSPYDINSVSGGTSYAYRANMKLYSGECETMAICAAPAASITDVTSTTVDITWIPGFDETEWDLAYREAGTVTWTVAETAETNTSYQFSNLTPGTDYEFRISFECNDGDATVYSTTLYTRTHCADISIPYTYGFEDMPTGSSTSRPDIPCWNHINNATSYYGYPYVSSTAHNSSRSLYWYGSTTTGTYADYEVVVLPPVDVETYPINTLQLTFWARPSSTSYAPVFLVGVMTDPQDINTFQYVDSVIVDHTTTDWNPYEVVFSSYTGNGQFIAVRANRPTSAWYAYTDDFTVENAPACPRITGVHTSSVDQTDVTIAWDGTDAFEYEIEYGPSGFDRGTGIMETNISDDSIALTGLQSNTAYDIYVRGVCTDDSSNWSFVYTFRTSCGLIATLPFTENFENQVTGSSSTGSPFIPCWSRLNNGTSYGGYPYVSNSSSYNHTQGGSMGLYWYGSTTTGTYGDYNYIILPEVDTLVYPMNTLQLSFWAKSSSTSYYPVFQVGIMDNNSDTNFQLISTINVNNNTEWGEYVTSFSAFAGTGSYVAIRALRPSSSWYSYVDDITLDVIPDCPRVEQLHATYTALDSIIISWVDTSTTNTSWYVEYSPVNFVPGSGEVSAIAVTDTFYVLSGLDSATTYHIYVYPSCDDYIGYRHIDVSTLAASPATVPYYCDFEEEGFNGWDLYTAGQTNHWMIGSAVNNGGTQSLYVTNNGTNNDYTISSISYSYAVRTFHLSDTGEYAYTFDWKCNGEGNYDFVRVLFAPAYVNTDAGTLPFGSSAYNFGQTVAPAPWIDITGQTTTPYGLNMQSTWQNRTGVMHISTPGNYKLVFAWANDGSGGTTPPAAIDNVALQLNQCSMVQNVVASLSSDSISLSWTPGGNENEWVLTLDSISVSVNTNSYTFTGLDPNTNYSVTVRAVCGSGDSSLVFSEVYHTPCTAVPVPYTENFDNLTTGTATSNLTVMPSCWDYVLTGSSSYQAASYYPGVYYNSSYAHSGNYSLRLYGVGYFMLPPVNVSLDSLQLTFWDYTTSTSYGLEVGVMEGNNFIPVQVVSTPASTNQEVQVFFGSYTGTSRIIAFRNYYTTSTTTGYSYHYIDNINVDYIPSCPHVTNLTSTGNTSSSVTLDWVENGGATQWEVAMATSASATPVGDTIAYSHPLTINGLTAGVSYYFWVRPICGIGDTGYWEGPIMCSPGSWNMRANMTDTLHMCGGIIYDDGGPMGDYALSQNSYIILYPSAPNNLVSISGTVAIEGNSYDNLYIYDGVGTSGTQLVALAGTSYSSGTTVSATSTSGPLTIYFKTDGSVVYSGFVLNVSCITTTCLVTGLDLDTNVSSTSTSLAIMWDAVTDATGYIVEYGTPGFVVGTGSQLTTNNNHIVISGLTSMANYDVYVRSICQGGDTGSWVHRTFTTPMCDNVSEIYSYDSTMNATTTSYAPVGYSLYNYSYVQTLIDSARFAELTDPISAFAFKPANTTSSNYYNHITMWMANVPETSLVAGAIIPDDSVHIFVPVITDADFSFTNTDWQMHSFDSAFTWDGHSNVLIAVKRDHGSYSSSGSFAAHSTSDIRTRYYYQDSGPISHTSPSASSSGTGSYIGDMKFFACGIACSRPSTLPATNVTYQSATVNWNSNATDFEVAVKAATDATWPAEVSVSNATSYTVYGLQPETMYQFRVRAICDATEGLISDWIEGTFTTAVLPCYVPTNLQASSTGYIDATLAWTADASQNQWMLHVWNTTFDTLYTANTNPFTVSGLSASTGYNAAVKSICGGGLVESDYSDTISFTTSTCAQVTGVQVSNVTTSTATVSWAGTATSYEVEYGDENFSQGTGTTVTTSANTVTITGLDDDETYDVYVRAICAPGVIGNWSAKATFTTSTGQETLYTITVTANDPTMGAVAGAGQYPMNATVTLSATPYQGYRFVSWNDGNTNATRQITVTGNASYMATFEAIPTYTITVSANNDQWGIVTGGGTFEEGSVITITATPNAGYEFVNWSDGNTEAVRTITVMSNFDYVATFIPQGSQVEYFSVTVTSNNDQWGTVTGSRDSVIGGSVVSISATANEGYRFVSWNDGVTAAQRNITVVSDTAFVATFEAMATYTITAVANDPAMGTVTGGGDYVEGTVVTLTATANAGYEFVDWTDGVTTAIRQVTVTGNATYTANFRQKQGISTVEGTMDFTIYPNPATSVTTVALSGVSGEVTITIVDMNGRTVQSETMSCEGDCTKRMEVSGLAQGAYFVRVSGEGVNQVKKLVVK